MRALIADDDRVTRTVLANALQQWGIEVAAAEDGVAAWEMLRGGEPPDIAILDWVMPGLDGVDLCRRVRANPSLAGMYVLLLTGRATREDLVAGLDAGADDYMVKPVDLEELRARVHVGRRVVSLQSRLAERVAELQAARDHLARLVSTDSLTEVYSRRWWFEIAATEFSRCRRYDRALGLIVTDLDFFKRVNDTYGHDSGDAVLRRFAEMLRSQCRQSDIVGRLGGEEFAILVPETTMSEAETVATRICHECRNLVVTTHAGIVRCTCSIGISEVRADDESIEGVLRRADHALYEAKRSGRDCWRCFSAETAGAFQKSTAASYSAGL
jgi:two-component system, cell cycle response regulator